MNDQLNQLYIDFELEGLSAKLSLGESTSSSSGSSGEEDSTNKRKSKKKFHYGKLMMIYEENAPFPPPNEP